MNNIYNIIYICINFNNFILRITIDLHSDSLSTIVVLALIYPYSYVNTRKVYGRYF